MVRAAQKKLCSCLKACLLTRPIIRIFIIEGLATVLVGVASKFFTVDWPETATFLTDEERKVLIAKLSQDNGGARMDHLDKRAAKRVFSDWKIYCAILMYLGIVNTGYSGSVSAFSDFVAINKSAAYFFYSLALIRYHITVFHSHHHTGTWLSSPTSTSTQCSNLRRSGSPLCDDSIPD